MQHVQVSRQQQAGLPSAQPRLQPTRLPQTSMTGNSCSLPGRALCRFVLAQCQQPSSAAQHQSCGSADRKALRSRLPPGLRLLRLLCRHAIPAHASCHDSACNNWCKVHLVCAAYMKMLRDLVSWSVLPGLLCQACIALVLNTLGVQYCRQARRAVVMLTDMCALRMLHVSHFMERQS